jgi:nitroreductase
MTVLQHPNQSHWCSGWNPFTCKDVSLETPEPFQLKQMFEHQLLILPTPAMSNPKAAGLSAAFIPEIDQRWSPRAFSSQVPATEALQRVFEAASWAASSYNEQPWRFVLGIRGAEGALGDAYGKVFGALNEWNQAWAQTAPVVVAVLAKKHFSHSGQLNRHHWYDAGQAAATLALQAAREGLYVHQMAGFSGTQLRENLGLTDEEFEPVAILTLGYAAAAETLPESYQQAEKAPRSRKPLSELVFADGLQTAAF